MYPVILCQTAEDLHSKHSIHVQTQQIECREIRAIPFKAQFYKINSMSICVTYSIFPVRCSDCFQTIETETIQFHDKSECKKNLNIFKLEKFNYMINYRNEMQPLRKALLSGRDETTTVLHILVVVVVVVVVTVRHACYGEQ